MVMSAEMDVVVRRERAGVPMGLSESPSVSDVSRACVDSSAIRSLPRYAAIELICRCAVQSPACKKPKFNCNDAIPDAASWRLCSVRDSMCWKDHRGRVTKGTSLWIGLSAYNKMYFVELGEKKKPRLTWSVTAGYKYKVGKYWNGREVSFSAHTFTPVLDTNYAEMYIYHRYMTQSFRALAVSNSKCHSDMYRYV